MASSNKMKLPEQQSNYSNSTVPRIPATRNVSSTEEGEDQAPEQKEVLLALTPGAVSETEFHSSDKVGREIDHVGPDTGETKIEDEPIDPQRQNATEAASTATVPGTATLSNDLDPDDGEESEFDDEQGSETDQDGLFNFYDLESTASEGGEPVNNSVPGPGADPRFPAPGEDIHVAENILNYGFGDDEGDSFEGIRDFTTDQGDAQKEASDIARTEASGGSDQGINETENAAIVAEDNVPMKLVTFALPGSRRGNEESNGSKTINPIGMDHDGMESSETEVASPAGSGQATTNGNGSVSAGVAFEEDTAAPSSAGEDIQRQRKNRVPEALSATTEATPGITIGEGENQASTITPDQDLGEISNQADLEIDHEPEGIDLFSPDIFDSPLRPTGSLGGTTDESKLDNVEAAPSPVGPVPVEAGYQGPDFRGLTADDDDDEEGQTEEALNKHMNSSDAVGVLANIALGAAVGNDVERHSGGAEKIGNSDTDQEMSQNPTEMSSLDRDQISLLHGHVDESQGEEDRNKGNPGEETSGDHSGEEAIHVGQALKPDRSAMKERNLDFDTVHLNIQYVVKGSKRSKASMCIAVPPTITFSSFNQTILDALLHHQGFDNPRPIDIDAQISRVMVVLAKKSDDASDFHGAWELTAANLQCTLGRLATGSIYDVVKVQFVPGTNGEVRPRKATGRIYGRSRKVGGL